MLAYPYSFQHASGRSPTDPIPFSEFAPGPPLRVAIYIRVSTEEQAEGHSLDAQRVSTRAL
ncbi:MAG: hypothetical protein JXA14_07750, partial [Anaerolineae bacterium]|nr:hypothetical protein [Anaerolineae bacterium]